jgi:hypothetical protein
VLFVLLCWAAYRAIILDVTSKNRKECKRKESDLGLVYTGSGSILYFCDFLNGNSLTLSTLDFWDVMVLLLLCSLQLTGSLPFFSYFFHHKSFFIVYSLNIPLQPNSCYFLPCL